MPCILLPCILLPRGLHNPCRGAHQIPAAACSLVKFSTELNKMPKYIASNACLVNVERAVGREA